MTGPTIAIVGGGIVGASIAYHLSERTNKPIVVYECGELAAETTSKSTAMIGVGGPEPYHRLKAYGYRLYNQFFASPTTDVRFRQEGRLRVTTSTDTTAKFQHIASSDSDNSGSDDPNELDSSQYNNSIVEFVSGAELKERFIVPSLNSEILEGALYRPQYGHILSDSETPGARELAFEFINRARKNGVTFQTKTEVTNVVTTGGRVSGLETNGSELTEVDTVVCAAGPWNIGLAKLAGLEFPIEHVLSPVFSMQLDRPLSCTIPVIKSHEPSVGIHAKREDLVLVTYTPVDDEGQSRYDPSSVSDPAPESYRRTALRWAERLMPDLADATLVDEWVGIGTSTPDRQPIVGWTAIEGFLIAATPAGIQYAPAVGSIISQQLVEETPSEYYDAVSITRFDEYTDCWMDD